MAMHNFDYAIPAELYVVNGGLGRRKQMTHLRFGDAAEAIQYVVEKLSPTRRAGAVMEINEKRHYYREIVALYDREDYPLARKPGKVTHADEAKLPLRTIGTRQVQGAKKGGKAASQG
jgi:hypothetical protein